MTGRSQAVLMVALVAAAYQVYAAEPDISKEAKMTALQIDSPMDYQVFQRSSRAAGLVFLKGRVAVAAEALEARLTGRSIAGDLAGEWVGLAKDPATGAFSVAKTVPAGGWYKIEMRAVNGKETVAVAGVEHVGVGEVFVTAGQSNSTSCGQFRTRQASGMVASFSGSAWQLAEDPQPGAHDMYALPNESIFFGGSPWPAFGDAMYARYNVPIGIAVTGHGGSGVLGWQPGGELFNWMMTRIKQFGEQGFRSVLWHQGESDVRTSSDDYYSRLAIIIKASNKEAGWEFPWCVAHASYGGPAPEAQKYEKPRAAQERLWKDGVAQQGPDTDILGPDYRDRDGAGGHFNLKGLKVHGEMWAACVSGYLDAALGE